MSKTNEIREYVRTLGDCERISNEHLAWIAAKFGVTEGYAALVVRGAGIRIGAGEFPAWRRPVQP